MEINYVKPYNLSSYQKNKFNKNFKKSPLQGNEHSVSMNKTQKTAAAVGGGLAALLSIGAALKGRRFMVVQSRIEHLAIRLNRIFRPDKNMYLPKTNGIKTDNIRQWEERVFSEYFIRPLQERLAGKKEFCPRDGILVVGPDSKAKTDFFERAVKEMEKNGVEIIDPKPGSNPHFDDVFDTWNKMFYKNGMTPDKAREEFRKNEKFKAFVVRNIDEMGESKKYPKGNPLQYEEEFLNDSPDTNYAASKFGLIKIFSAKSTRGLSPATIRTGRISWRMTPMPYDNEPVEVWKNYLDYVKDTNREEYVLKAIKHAKKLFASRGKEELKEIAPHLEFQRSYKNPDFKDSLKKWKDWTEYTSERKGVSDARRSIDLQYVLDDLAHYEGTSTSKEKRKQLKESPKFKAIVDMLYEKFLKIEKKYPEQYKESYARTIKFLEGSIEGKQKIIENFEERIKNDPKNKEKYLDIINSLNQSLEHTKKELEEFNQKGFDLEFSIKGHWLQHVAECLSGQLNRV